MAKRKPLNQVAYEAARRAAIRGGESAEDWPAFDELEKEDKNFWSGVASAVAKRDRQRRKLGPFGRK